jgi:Mrp family chromosome partitioning ATPase
LADALREGEACEAHVRATPLANLCVLTAGALDGQPSRAYDAVELGAAIKEFAVDFDLVVFDMPPAGETSFALRLAGLLDAVLLVVEAERVPAEVARRTTELLNRAQARLLGAVLNKRREPLAALPQTEF